jgi:hypothetical protein
LAGSNLDIENEKNQKFADENSNGDFDEDDFKDACETKE